MVSSVKAADLRWFQVVNVPKEYKRLAKVNPWLTFAAVDPNGDVWVPAVLSGRSEMEVALCLGYDGQHAVLNFEHVFVSGEWLACEFPKSAKMVDKIRRRISEVDDGK